MYPSSTLCLLAGLSLSSLVSASPLGLDIVKPRLVDVGRECTNRPPFQAVCWDALRIPEYYKNWTESNRGACDDQAIYLNDAVCFIRLVTGKTFFCNETGLTDAEEIELCGINYPMLEQLSAQEAYVLRAIYGVWKWFSSITKALTDAPPAITAGVQVIADQFEPLPQPLSLTPTFLYRSVMAGVIDISFPASNLDIAHAYGQANQLQTPANSISWDLSEFFNPLNGFPGKENVYEWDQSTPFNGSLLLENRYILNQGLHTILRFYQKFLAVNDKGSFMEDGK